MDRDVDPRPPDGRSPQPLGMNAYTFDPQRHLHAHEAMLAMVGGQAQADAERTWRTRLWASRMVWSLIGMLIVLVIRDFTLISVLLTAQRTDDALTAALIGFVAILLVGFEAAVATWLTQRARTRGTWALMLWSALIVGHALVTVIAVLGDQNTAGPLVALAHGDLGSGLLSLADTMTMAGCLIIMSVVAGFAALTVVTGLSRPPA
jgi:hypothetical protein